jgi:hypothetical protein
LSLARLDALAAPAQALAAESLERARRDLPIAADLARVVAVGPDAPSAA